MNVKCFNSCWKSWIIRRIKWQSISQMVHLLSKLECETKDYDERMDATCNVEGWVNKLGKVEGFEGI